MHMCVPHDPHDRPLGLASPYLSTHTHTQYPVYIVTVAYSGVCGQHDAVRLLTEAICSADMLGEDL